MTTETKRRGRPSGSSPEVLQRMQKIIDFVRTFQRENHFAPTLKEIAVGIGKREEDFGNIQPYVKHLIDEGFLISAGKNSGRSLAVAKNPPRKYFYKPD